MEKGRHETTLPVVSPIDGMSARIGENQIRGEVLAFAAESIRDPTPHRRPSGHSRNTAVEVADRDLMPVVSRVHRPNHADVIDDRSGVRQKFAHIGAAFAVLRELPRRAKQFLTGSIGEAEDDLTAVVLAVVFGQLGLRVEQVHVSRTAVHEHRDHRRRLRREVRCARLHVARLIVLRFDGRSCEQPFVAQQTRQRE